MTLSEWFMQTFPIYVTQGKTMGMFYEVAEQAYQLGYEDGRNHHDNKNEVKR